MADTALILGIVGVAGTITGTMAGALIGARSTAAIERRREIREQEENDAVFRAAARLLWLDLMRCTGSLRTALRTQRWAPEYQLPTDAWESYRDPLAVGLSDNLEWGYVAIAMEGIYRLQARPPTDGPLEREAAIDLHMTKDYIERAAKLVWEKSGAPVTAEAAIAPDP
jgi:hypothetical protein